MTQQPDEAEAMSVEKTLLRLGRPKVGDGAIPEKNGDPVMPQNLEQCPFCDGAINQHWRTVDVWKCSQCGLLFRNPMPYQDELAKLYEKGWSQAYQHRSETGGTDLYLARVYARKLAGLLHRKNFSGLKILDFGAGRGAMLTALAELGADVCGVEPFGYQFLKERGFTTFRTLDEVPKGLTFDGITMIEVIEHLPAPWNEIRRFSEILKDSQWTYIATPNACGLNARVSRSSWREVLKPGHLIFFTPRSLETILTNCGMARYRRLPWFIHYSKNPIRILLHYILQALYLDGELRYLAWKS